MQLTSTQNQYRLIRHATLWIQMNGVKMLVDPMLSPKYALEPVPNAANNSRIPMVDLPIDGAELDILLADVDAILITHLHRDHWDVAAQQLIRKDISVFCQPGDIDALQAQGFQNVTVVQDQVSLKGISITRTTGHHGTGEIEKKMGNVSGFILRDEHDVVYIAGDTIWCEEVKQAILLHKPRLTIVNSGAPQYLTGAPITMSAEDVIEVCKTLPEMEVAAVHLETINHCTLNRAQLRSALENAGLNSKVMIPEDGAFFG